MHVFKLITDHLKKKSPQRSDPAYQAELNHSFDICSVSEDDLKLILCPDLLEDLKAVPQVPWSISDKLDDEFNEKTATSLARKRRTAEYLASNAATDNSVSPITPRATPTECDTPLDKRQSKPVKLFNIHYEGHAVDRWLGNASDSDSANELEDILNDMSWPLPLRYKRELNKRPDYVCANFDTKELVRNMAKTSVINKTSLTPGISPQK